MTARWSVWCLTSELHFPNNLTKFLLFPLCSIDNIKVQYLQFMAHMKTPQYRTNLQQLLEQEKVIDIYRLC